MPRLLLKRLNHRVLPPTLAPALLLGSMLSHNVQAHAAASASLTTDAALQTPAGAPADIVSC